MNDYTIAPSEIFNVWGKQISDIAVPGSAPDVFSMIPHYFYEFNNDPDVLVIYAGPVPGPDNLNFVYSPIHLLRNYLLKHVTPKTKICFDNLFEGTVSFELDTIYRSLVGTPIKPSQIYYFSCALDSEKSLDEYIKLRPSAQRINMYSCNAWEYNLVKASKEFTNNYEIKVKEKLFLCFNRVLREHRLAMFALVASRKLLDNSFYSFFVDLYYAENVDGKLKKLSTYLSKQTYSEIVTSYNDNKHLLPLKLNIEPNENQNTIKADDLRLFSESYLSLVSETFFFPQVHHRGMIDFTSIFFSEKIYKPILMKHPFILAGRPNSLKYLGKLGYKTFAPFVDETYDTILDDEARLLAIVDELERLNKFTDDQWIEWQAGVAPILEHNYLIMTNRKKHEYAFTRPNYETKY